MTQSNLLNRSEAAVYLRHSPRTLDRWRAERKGPAVTRVGNKVFYRVSSLDDWLTRNTDEMPRDNPVAAWSAKAPQPTNSPRRKRTDPTFVTGYSEYLDFFVSPRDFQHVAQPRHH